MDISAIGRAFRARAGGLAGASGALASRVGALRRNRPPPRARPSRSVRRAWHAQLDEMGPGVVEDMLHRSSTPQAGPDDRVPFIDAGMAHGGQRYPTRQFVEDWLGGNEAPDDLGRWRAAVAVIMLVALVSFGLLALLS